LDESHKQLQQQKDAHSAEQAQLQTRIRELQNAQSEIEQKVKSLADNLTAETQRRQQAEQQVNQLGQQRSKLESQLAETKQAQAELQRTLEELSKQLRAEQEQFAAEQTRLAERTRELETLSKELASTRDRLEEEVSLRQKVADLAAQSERANAKLTSELDASRELVTKQENSIKELDRQARNQHAELERLESSLQAETLEGRKKLSRIEQLEQENSELTGELSRSVAEQQEWQQRASELEVQLQKQKDETATAAATAAVREAELNRQKAELQELRLLQSVLCDRVRELTRQGEDASSQIEDLTAQSDQAAKTIQSRDQELAGLRYAILDAARFEAQINREHLRMERQRVDGWRRLIATLFHTPLSTAQRGLVTEIGGALDGWEHRRTHPSGGSRFPVEPPNLHRSKFDCAEVLESALTAVRETAENGRAKVQTAVVGALPDCVYGNPAYLHQLINALAEALPKVAGADRLTLNVSSKENPDGTAELLLELLLASTVADEAMGLRLAGLTAASGKLRTGGSGESELALAAAWQLALALGGRPSIETTTNGEVRIEILVSLGATAPLLSARESGPRSTESNTEAAKPSASTSVRIATNGESHDEAVHQPMADGAAQPGQE